MHSFLRVRAFRFMLMLSAIMVTAGTAVSPAKAQQVDSRRFSIGVLGGGSRPLGTLDDFAQTGFNLGLMAAYRLRSLPIAFTLDLARHNFGLSQNALAELEAPSADGTIKIDHFGLALAYSLPISGRVTPYLLAGVGVYGLRFSLSEDLGGDVREGFRDETHAGFNGGAGIRVNLGRVRPFVETRYHTVSFEGENTNFAPVSIGLSF